MWVKSWPEALLQWQSAILVSLGFSRSLEEEAEEVLFFILNLSNHLRLLRFAKDSAKGGRTMIPTRRLWFKISEPSSMIIVVLILCLWRRSFRLIVAFQWFLMHFQFNVERTWQCQPIYCQDCYVQKQELLLPPCSNRHMHPCPPTCRWWPQKVVEQILQAIFLNNFL